MKLGLGIGLSYMQANPLAWVPAGADYAMDFVHNRAVFDGTSYSTIAGFAFEIASLKACLRRVQGLGLLSYRPNARAVSRFTFRACSVPLPQRRQCFTPGRIYRSRHRIMRASQFLRLPRNGFNFSRCRSGSCPEEGCLQPHLVVSFVVHFLSFCASVARAFCMALPAYSFTMALLECPVMART